MILSLAACGNKTDEVKETADMNSSKQDRVEETVKEDEEPVSEPEVDKVPDQVELTADTIDRYFGFQYANVAEDSITGFSFTNDADYGNSVIEIGSLPAAYTATTAPDLTQIEDITHTSTQSFKPYTLVNPDCMLWTTEGKYALLQDNIAIYGDIDSSATLDGSEFAGDARIRDYLVEQNIPTAAFYEGRAHYAVLVPGQVLDTIPANGADLLVYNASDDFVSVMDGTFVGLSMNFDQMDLAVAGDITAESTIEDVVAKHAPSAGTITDNGSIVLTWNTASGTVVEITFAADTYKAMSVKMITSDVPADIFEMLHL
jgi:hypothetical protein